jgi:hypothetical protein
VFTADHDLRPRTTERPAKPVTLGFATSHVIPSMSGSTVQEAGAM